MATTEFREGQQWGTRPVDPGVGVAWETAAIRRVESGYVHFRHCEYTGRGVEMFAGNNTLSCEEFAARFPCFVQQAWEPDSDDGD